MCLGVAFDTTTASVVALAQQVQELQEASESDSSIRDVFATAHDGWSLDEVLIQDDLRRKVVEAYAASGGTLAESELFEELISLRKSGKLQVETTKSGTHASESVVPAAEIAARQVIEATKESLDRIFVDPELLKKFDKAVQEVAPGADVYSARKAAMRLRKARQLRPELLARVTD